jgi:hypothetical protein
MTPRARHNHHITITTMTLCDDAHWQEDRLLLAADMGRLVPPPPPLSPAGAAPAAATAAAQAHLAAQQRAVLSQYALFAVFDGHNGLG